MKSKNSPRKKNNLEGSNEDYLETRTMSREENKAEQMLSQRDNHEDTNLNEDKVIILDDNELSIIMYAEEYPENWERICKALEDRK